jgi:putative transposase
MVDASDPELTVARQAELLKVNRSSLYYEPRLPDPGEVLIKHKIDEIYTKYPFYGSRRISVELREEHQLVVNRKAVQRHMREMGIRAIFPGPNLSRRAHQHAIYPYLLRDVTAAAADHIWGIDITYIRLQKAWMYLVAILDWYTRFVVAWELDDTLEMPFVLTAVDRALSLGTPMIWNSDQGCHFTSPQYIQRLKDRDIRISMDGKGRALDNIFTERLWRTIKYEEVYLNEYTSPKQARSRLSAFIQFYNNERRHQSLGYRTPASLYAAREPGPIGEG